MQGKTVDEMADAFESMAKQIQAQHPNWTAMRTLGLDGSAIFTGTNVKNTLVISPAGKIFLADASPGSGHFAVAARGLTPVFEKMKEIR